MGGDARTVGILAAVVIPLANGGSGKTYTLAATPASTCASPATTTVTIKNTGSPQSIGSAQIYFPPNTVASVSSGMPQGNTSNASSGGTKDIVALDDLDLAPNASKAIVVTFKAGVTFSATITAAAKQSNKFNDSSGGANLFSIEGGFPTLKIVTCVTVSGRVYQDRNLDNVFTTGNGAFDDSDLPKAWTVNLYVKNGSSYSVYKTVSPSSSIDGSYTFSQVPTGSDYRICITALGGDALPPKKWGLQSPIGPPDCAAISSGGPTTAAQSLPNLSKDEPDRDFQVVPVVGPIGPSSQNSIVGGYTVDPSSNSTKLDDFYVQDVWVDSSGNTNFRFSPIKKCTPPNCPSGKIYLLETLVTNADIANLNGAQVTLSYDDDPPFLDGDLKPMPYCLIDPTAGQQSGQLATSGVLPTGATSCIVTGEQSVSAATGKVHVEYSVYTAYDGGRQIGLG